MSIDLALADAANNCARQGAVGTLTMKSGATVSGKIEKSSGADLGTIHVMKSDGGWATVDTSEIAIVEVKPGPRPRI